VSSDPRLFKFHFVELPEPYASLLIPVFPNLPFGLLLGGAIERASSVNGDFVTSDLPDDPWVGRWLAVYSAGLIFIILSSAALIESAKKYTQQDWGSKASASFA
jgi:hypothetical protein